jgi:hypothetical protein
MSLVVVTGRLIYVDIFSPVTLQEILSMTLIKFQLIPLTRRQQTVYVMARAMKNLIDFSFRSLLVESPSVKLPSTSLQ